MSAAISRQIVRVDTLNSNARFVVCIMPSTAQHFYQLLPPFARAHVFTPSPPLSGVNDKKYKRQLLSWLKKFKTTPWSAEWFFIVTSENLMMCQGSNFRRRGGERQRGRCFSAIEWHDGLRQCRKTKMTAWQKAIRSLSLGAMGLSDRMWVISTLRVFCPVTGGGLFWQFIKISINEQFWKMTKKKA